MRNLINFKENKRTLVELRQEFKRLWEDRKSKMWTELINKIDNKHDSKDFWREINKMRGLSRKKKKGAMKKEGEERGSCQRRRRALSDGRMSLTTRVEGGEPYIGVGGHRLSKGKGHLPKIGIHSCSRVRSADLLLPECQGRGQDHD